MLTFIIKHNIFVVIHISKCYNAPSHRMRFLDKHDTPSFNLASYVNLYKKQISTTLTKVNKMLVFVDSGGTPTYTTQNPKIILVHVAVSGPGCDSEFSIFKHNFLLYQNTLWALLGCECASVLLIFVWKTDLVRVMCFSAGDSPPLRLCLGSCAETLLQKASYVGIFFFIHMHCYSCWLVLLF